MNWLKALWNEAQYIPAKERFWWLLLILFSVTAYYIPPYPFSNPWYLPSLPWIAFFFSLYRPQKSPLVAMAFSIILLLKHWHHPYHDIVFIVFTTAWTALAAYIVWQLFLLYVKHPAKEIIKEAQWFRAVYAETQALPEAERFKWLFSLWWSRFGQVAFIITVACTVLFYRTPEDAASLWWFGTKVGTEEEKYG